MEFAVRLSVMDGRRSFMEKGRKTHFNLMKSVRKYQIVGNDQKVLLGMEGVRANKRVRNSQVKSCKKELIPLIDYVIVCINLEKTKYLCSRQDIRNGGPIGGFNCQFRRKWRKCINTVKKLMFSLAFYSQNGYTSVVNNLLSGDARHFIINDRFPAGEIIRRKRK